MKGLVGIGGTVFQNNGLGMEFDIPTLVVQRITLGPTPAPIRLAQREIEKTPDRMSLAEEGRSVLHPKGGPKLIQSFRQNRRGQPGLFSGTEKDQGDFTFKFGTRFLPNRTRLRVCPFRLFGKPGQQRLLQTLGQ